MNVVKNAPMTVKVRKRKLAEIATDEEPPSGEYLNNPFALPRRRLIPMNDLCPNVPSHCLW